MFATTSRLRAHRACLPALLLLSALLWARPTHAQTLPTLTPTPTPTVARTVAAEAAVLVDRLRVRSGPDVGFPILERATPGQRLIVLGQSDECAWLQVLLAGGKRGWVSGETGLVALNVPCSRVPLRPTPTLAPPATATLPPTATREPTATRTPVPTRTAVPTRTPTPTITPTPMTAPVLSIRPAVAPPATPTPVRPRPVASLPAPLPTPTRNLRSALAAGGPTSVTGLSPEPEYVNRVRTVFSWTPDQPLLPGQLFEVAFWTRDQSPELGVGWTQATTEPALAVRLDEQIPGDYLWGVWLGAFVDGQYERLRYLGGGNSLRVAGERVREEAPVVNCPPDAPCK